MSKALNSIQSLLPSTSLFDRFGVKSTSNSYLVVSVGAGSYRGYYKIHEYDLDGKLIKLGKWRNPSSWANYFSDLDEIKLTNNGVLERSSTPIIDDYIERPNPELTQSGQLVPVPKATIPTQDYNSNWGYGEVNARRAIELAIGKNVPTAAPVYRSFAEGSNSDPNYWADHLDRIEAPACWNAGIDGSGVVIALIDVGVDLTPLHPALQGKLWVNTDEVTGDGIDNDNNGYVDDFQGWNTELDNNDISQIKPDYSHGTECAGIMVGSDDGTIKGIAYNSKLMVIQSYYAPEDGGNPRGGYQSQLDALRYAADNGAKVVAFEYQGLSTQAELQSMREALEYCESKGVVVCTAAANYSEDNTGFPSYYSTYTSIACGCNDRNGDLASYSNKAGIARSIHGNPTAFPLYVTAQGEKIYTTTQDGGYRLFNGTSASTPVIAAVCALIMSANPSLTPQDVRAIIAKSSMKLGASPSS